MYPRPSKRSSIPPATGGLRLRPSSHHRIAADVAGVSPSRLHPTRLAALTSKSNPGLVLLLLSTMLGFFLPSAAAVCFLAVSAFLVIPLREIVTALRRLRGRRS